MHNPIAVFRVVTICAIFWAVIFTHACNATVPPLDLTGHNVTYTWYDWSERDVFLAARGKETVPGVTNWGFTRRTYINGLPTYAIHIVRSWPDVNECRLRHEQRHVLDMGWHGSRNNNDCDTHGRGMARNGDWSY
jgi:hypothetical protein